MKNLWRLHVMLFVFFSFISLLSYAAPNLDNPVDLKSWFDGTMFMALKKDTLGKFFISDKQIRNTAEIAKLKINESKIEGFDSNYVDSEVNKIFDKRAKPLEVDWLFLFNRMINRSFKTKKDEFIISNEAILDIARLAKEHGVDPQYVNRLVDDVFRKRTNPQREYSKNQLMGIIQSALNRNEKGDLLISDKQLHTVIDKAIANGLEPEFVNFIKKEIFDARHKKLTKACVQARFDEDMKNSEFIFEQQIIDSADLAIVLGLDTEYVMAEYQKVLDARELTKSKSNDSYLATPVGQSYADNALVLAESKEILTISEPSLAVPYGSNLATPVGKSYTDNELVLARSKEILPVADSLPPVPYVSNFTALVKKTNPDNGLVLADSKEILPIVDYSLPVRHCYNCPISVQKPDIDYEFVLPGLKNIKVLTVEEIKYLILQAVHTPSGISFLKSLPKMKSKAFSNMRLYGTATLLGFGLGAVYVHREKIYTILNALKTEKTDGNDSLIVHDIPQNSDYVVPKVQKNEELKIQKTFHISNLKKLIRLLKNPSYNPFLEDYQKTSNFGLNKHQNFKNNGIL